MIQSHLKSRRIKKYFKAHVLKQTPKKVYFIISIKIVFIHFGSVVQTRAKFLSVEKTADKNNGRDEWHQTSGASN
jgi:hypothetical protein